MAGALGVYNTAMAQGATWKRTFTYKLADDNNVLQPVDLSTYTARMQIRRGYEGEVLVDLTEGNGIVLGGVDGTIEVTVTALQTEAIPVLTAEDPKVWPKHDTLLYDLELVNGAEVTRFLEGKLEFSRNVTR